MNISESKPVKQLGVHEYTHQMKTYCKRKKIRSQYLEALTNCVIFLQIEFGISYILQSQKIKVSIKHGKL